MCLGCDERVAESLILDAAKVEKALAENDKRLKEYPYGIIEGAPPTPPRLPILPSLLEPYEPGVLANLNNLADLGNLGNLANNLNLEDRIENASEGDERINIDVNADHPVFPFGLLLPPSKLSIHRPLAPALPTPETLRRGFDALLNAKSNVYLYQAPSHVGVDPSTDRLSVYTCECLVYRRSFGCLG